MGGAGVVLMEGPKAGKYSAAKTDDECGWGEGEIHAGKNECVIDPKGRSNKCVCLRGWKGSPEFLKT